MKINISKIDNNDALSEVEVATANRITGGSWIGEYLKFGDSEAFGFAGAFGDKTSKEIELKVGENGSSSSSKSSSSS